MKKVNLWIEENLRYRRQVEVNIPDELSEDELNEILDEAQGNHALDDFIYALKKKGIEFPKGYDDDLSYPDRSEVECTDFTIESQYN